jgi:hypothetical protein
MHQSIEPMIIPVYLMGGLERKAAVHSVDGVRSCFSVDEQFMYPAI